MLTADSAGGSGGSGSGGGSRARRRQCRWHCNSALRLIAMHKEAGRRRVTPRRACRQSCTRFRGPVSPSACSDRMSSTAHERHNASGGPGTPRTRGCNKGSSHARPGRPPCTRYRVRSIAGLRPVPSGTYRLPRLAALNCNLLRAGSRCRPGRLRRSKAHLKVTGIPAAHPWTAVGTGGGSGGGSSGNVVTVALPRKLQATSASALTAL